MQGQLMCAESDLSLPMQSQTYRELRNVRPRKKQSLVKLRSSGDTFRHESLGLLKTRMGFRMLLAVLKA